MNRRDSRTKEITSWNVHKGYSLVHQQDKPCRNLSMAGILTTYFGNDKGQSIPRIFLSMGRLLSYSPLTWQQGLPGFPQISS